jgi:2-polyprenyl-3-methyl-5-hydroxy-6-metoxy-1,4-benzoquinol methylase
VDQYQETFTTWNKIAKVYEEKFMKIAIYNSSYDLFLSSLQKNESLILDIGCGPGNISKYLLSKNKLLKIYGIDTSINMIELARINNPSANFDAMDIREIKTLNTRFDGIISGFCIPYISQQETNFLIEDCNKLLNTNGIIYLSFVEGEESKSGFIKNSVGDRVYFYYHELKNILNSLLKNNFVEPAILNIQYPKSEDNFEIHTAIIAKKNN